MNIKNYVLDEKLEVNRNNIIKLKIKSIIILRKTVKAKKNKTNKNKTTQ